MSLRKVSIIFLWPLSAFWHWWIGELNGLFSGLQSKSPNQSPALIRITLGESGSVAEEIQDGHAREIGRFEGLASAADTLMGINEEIAKKGILADNWELILPPSAMLERTIDLPSIETHQVKKAVSYQIDRFMPMRVDQTLFDSLAIEIIDGKVNKADLALVKKTTVDEAILAMKGSGARLFRVCARSKRDPAVLFEFFRTYGFGRVRHSNLRRVLWVCLILSEALLPAVFIGFVIHKHHVIEARERTLRAPVRRVEALHSQIVAKNELWHFIKGKVEVPQLLTIINGMSSVLPQDAWIYDLKQDGQTIVIMGEAVGAQKLIPLIEASNLFTNVKNLTVSSKGDSSGRERFEISFDLENINSAASVKGVKR